jgi:hypothetical protein
MKNRQGFVSNSSSSSYIIVWPKARPLTIEQVQQYFLGGQSKISTALGELSAEHAAAVLLDCLRRHPPNNEQLFETVLEGEVAGLPVYPWPTPSRQSPGISDEEYQAAWEAYDDDLWAHVKAWWASEKQKMDPAQNDFYVLEISDKNSDEAILEASGVLLTVPHIYSSFH